MDISLSDDQLMLADTVRELLAEAWPREQMRKYVSSFPAADDSSLWDTLVGSEFQSIAAPEALGGGGASIEDLVPVLEQFGYALTPSRFETSSVVGTLALAWCSEGELRARLLAGHSRFAVASGDDVAAVVNDPRTELNGRVSFAADVDGATHLLLVLPDEIVVVDLENASAGVTVVPAETVDATRRVSHVEFEGVKIDFDHVLSADASHQNLRQCVRDLRMLCTACDSLGGSSRALDMAVEYSKQRHQFGRPIGSFQSLQHMMADAYVSIENLRSAVWYAAYALQHRTDDLDFAILAASVLASQTYLQVSDLNVQVHGGMGFTKEVDAYLYSARAKVNEVRDGSVGSRTASVAKWLRSAPLEPLVDYLGGQHLQIKSSKFLAA